MRRTNLATLLVFCGLMISLVSCGFLGELFATEFSGDISVPTTTKAGTYKVSDCFTVSSVWTIEPGAVFIVDPDIWIDVASAGQIKAVGTANDPIVFRSSKPTPAKGDWYGIDDEGNGSVYTFCVIEHADEGLDMGGKLSSVTSCAFSDNTVGLDLHDAPSMSALSSNAFSSNVDPLIVNGLYDLDDTNTFTGNTHQYVTLDSGTIAAARSWGLVKVPLFVDSGFYVEAVLTILPGVRLSMGPDTWIEVASAGSLRAIGTEAAPISFVSSKPTPAAGDWYGITIDGNGCVMDYCEVRHADTGITINAADFILTNSTLDSNNTSYDASGAVGWTAGTGNSIE